MGLSSFASALEGLLPLVVANAALSVSSMKSTLRCIRQLMGSPREEKKELASLFPCLDRHSLWHGRGRKLMGECCAVCLCRFEAEEEVGGVEVRVPEEVVRQSTTT